MEGSGGERGGGKGGDANSVPRGMCEFVCTHREWVCKGMLMDGCTLLAPCCGVAVMCGENGWNVHCGDGAYEWVLFGFFNTMGWNGGAVLGSRRTDFITTFKQEPNIFLHWCL